MSRSLLMFLGALGLAAGTAWAQATPPPAEEKKEDETVKREEVLTVTATKGVESTIVNAPATISVIGSDAIAIAPSSNYADLLRNVPGLNVIQMSARDINVTSRQSTSTLSNSQLALLDGRSIYLDFFGLILWDLVPASTGEIKQIEVVRGPASAVWGANALTGVVNIITKTPRDLAKEAAGSLTLTGGLLNRGDGSRADDGNGYAYGVSGYVAQAPNDKWSYKLSAGYFNSDPFSRPTGRVPLDCHPLGTIPCRDAQGGATPGGVPTGGAPYPPDTDTAGGFRNGNTSQPKVDVRVDQELGSDGSGGHMSYSGGYAGTTGIVHTGIGPFQLQSGSYLGYGRVGYSKGAFKVSGFVNFLDADAPNLLLTDPDTLAPVQLSFKTQTFDLEAGHSLVLGGKNILTFGGNARRNNFDITLAPDAQDRNEFGAYVQDELFFDKFRLNVGMRVDKFGNLDSAFFSPRVTAMFKPTPQHSIRISFNRAFRAPSAINNYLLQDILLTSPLIDLRGLVPFAPPALRPSLSQPFQLRVRNVGSEVRRTAGSPVPGTDTPLDAESLNAYELAYTGTFGKTTLGLAVYQNDQDNNINFTTVAPTGAFAPAPGPGFDIYTPGNAPSVIGNVPGTGAPVPTPPIPGPVLVGFLAAVPGVPPLPRTVATYLNLGPIRQKGLEASITHNLNDVWSLSGNYSFQADPKPLDPDQGQLPYPTAEIGVPARHRFNAGVGWNSKRFLGSANVNYVDKAFWTDVLSAPFYGATDSYTMVNAAFGVKWLDGKLTTTLKGTNLLNETIQQHVFGDIIKMQLYFEARMLF